MSKHSHIQGCQEDARVPAAWRKRCSGAALLGQCGHCHCLRPGRALSSRPTCLMAAERLGTL